MKAPKLTLLFLSFILVTESFAQKQLWLQHVAPHLNRKTSVDCSVPVSQNGCNYIANSSFTPGPAFDPNDFNHYLDPFGLQLITGWESSQGSAQLVPNNNGMTDAPPFPGIKTAFLGASSAANPTDPGNSEGIASHIPQLTTGHTYSLSFFKKYKVYFFSNGAPLEKFYVVLLHCESFRDNVYTTTYYTPQVPPGSQVVYCETNFSNPNWEQNNVCFTANSDYDMIWIFPDYPTFVPLNPTNLYGGMLFAYPELYDVTNFTAGPVPAVNYPACAVTIGPSVPNCGPQNASFFWTSPSGQTFPVSATNQQLLINAATDYGIWTLSMTVPTAVSTNNTCSQTCLVTKTVNVPRCSPCPNISPSGPVEYYFPNAEQTIQVPFSSSFATGNQWYVDGVPVSGATNPTFNYAWITPNGLPETHQVSLQVPGCPPSTPVSVSFIPHYFPCSNPVSPANHCLPPGINTPYHYCENTNSYIQTFNMGPSASYSWQLSSTSPVTITSQSQNVVQITIGPTAYPGGWGSVLAKTELNGYVKYFDHSFSISSDSYLAGLGGCASVNHPQMTIQIQPSGFNNEFYDFGAADIISVDPLPVSPYFVTQHTLYTSGLNPLTKIKLKRNGVTNYKVNYTNINNDDCYKVNYIIYLDNNCVPAWRSPITPLATILPEENKETVSPEIDKMQTGAIQRIEIFNTAGQVLKQLTGTTEMNEVLKYNRSAGLSSGLYFLRVVYKDKTVKVVRKLL